MAFLRTQRPVDDDTWKDLRQPFAFVAKNSAEQTLRLEYIRESRSYRTQLGLTWAKFCIQYAGITRSHADSLIRRREVFGDAYFRLTLFVVISPTTYRKIASHVTSDGLEIDGRRIAFTYANTEELRSAVRRLRIRLKHSPKPRRRATAQYSIPLP